MAVITLFQVEQRSQSTHQNFARHGMEHTSSSFMRDIRAGDFLVWTIEKIGGLILFFLIEELANKLRKLCHKSFRSLLASDG